MSLVIFFSFPNSADQDQSVGYISESQSSDSLRWHCGLPASSQLGEIPAQMPSYPLPHLEGLDNAKNRISKPAHMRRNIRCVYTL